MPLYFVLVPRSIFELIMLFLICVFGKSIIAIEKKNYSLLYVDNFFYCVTLLKVCAHCNNFLVVPLEPVTCRVLPPAAKDTLISYPICVPFFSFSFLTVLAKAKHRMGAASIDISPLALKEMLPVFPQNVGVHLPHAAFILLSCVPSVPAFSGAFVCKRCGTLSKAFFASTRMIGDFCP